LLLECRQNFTQEASFVVELRQVLYVRIKLVELQERFKLIESPELFDLLTDLRPGSRQRNRTTITARKTRTTVCSHEYSLYTVDI
jgi:hypothetical protein